MLVRAVVGLDRRQEIPAIIAAHHPHLRLPVLILHDGRAGTPARAAQRRDRPPPPACKHRAVSDGFSAVSHTRRSDEAVLGEPETRAAGETRARSRVLRRAADDVQRAVRLEGRAQEQAADQTVVELVERGEQARLCVRLHLGRQECERGQSSAVCSDEVSQDGGEGWVPCSTCSTTARMRRSSSSRSPARRS